MAAVVMEGCGARMEAVTVGFVASNAPGSERRSRWRGPQGLEDTSMSLFVSRGESSRWSIDFPEARCRMAGS